jgi:hypothetical protein
MKGDLKPYRNMKLKILRSSKTGSFARPLMVYMNINTCRVILIASLLIVFRRLGVGVGDPFQHILEFLVSSMACT